MNELMQHPRLIFEVLAAYWGFSAIVTGMPEPPAGSFYYKWAYATLHAFAGNLTKFAENKIQSLETTTTKTTVTESNPKKDGE